MWKIARVQGPKFLFFFVRIAVLIVIIINGGAKILENKGPKNTRCNVGNRLKFGKISRKGLLCTKT